MSFYLHNNTWSQIEKDLIKCDTVIVPLGSIEPHGTHKPLGCCYILAEEVSKEVGEKTGVLVTPVVPFGCSRPYAHFPGTMSVSIETLIKYVFESCENLAKNGVKKIIFMSAHGGDNLSALREVSFLLREKHEVMCAVIHVWGVISQHVPKDFWGPKLRMGHGGEPVTSVMLFLHPELVNMDQAKLNELIDIGEGFKTNNYGSHNFNGLLQNIYLFAEEVEKEGFMGDPTRASAEKGKILYEKTIEYLVNFVEKYRKLSHKKRY